MLRRLPWKPRQDGVLLGEAECPMFPARLKRGAGVRVEGPPKKRYRDTE